MTEELNNNAIMLKRKLDNNDFSNDQKIINDCLNLLISPSSYNPNGHLIEKWLTINEDLSPEYALNLIISLKNAYLPSINRSDVEKQRALWDKLYILAENKVKNITPEIQR